MNERKSPHEMSVQELQDGIAEMQSLLHFKICGDPRTGVTAQPYMPDPRIGAIAQALPAEPPRGRDRSMIERRTPLPLLKRLTEAAQKSAMTPSEVRAQKISFIRGQTGASTEEILRVLPELAP